MQPIDAPFPKELTFFLHKDKTNPYSQMKENNQSQKPSNTQVQWAKIMQPLVGHRCADSYSNEKPYSCLFFFCSCLPKPPELIA